MTTQPNPEEKPTLEECLECLRMWLDAAEFAGMGETSAAMANMRRAKQESHRILSLAGESEDGS